MIPSPDGERGFATRCHPGGVCLQIPRGGIEAGLCQCLRYLRRFGVGAGSHQRIAFRVESQIAPSAAGDLHSRNRLLVQDFQADSRVP